ncbi:MAG: SRPBCC family protein [Jatrophihabitans sp.]
MASDSRYLVTVSRTIAADRQTLFDIIADPAQHPVIDGSGSVRAVRAGGPERLSLGSRFSMDMHLGTAYKIANTVVEFEEPAVIGWRHFNGHIWRYSFLAAADGATEVTEQWDARRAKRKWGLLLLGFPKRNEQGMTRTLERLDRLVASAQ